MYFLVQISMDKHIIPGTLLKNPNLEVIMEKIWKNKFLNNTQGSLK